MNRNIQLDALRNRIMCEIEQTIAEQNVSLLSLESEMRTEDADHKKLSEHLESYKLASIERLLFEWVIDQVDDVEFDC